VNSAYLSPIANHLWQSTLFAAIAGLLILLLRNNRARVRHWIWLAASWKFLIPFSFLISLGGHIHWRTSPRTEHPSLSVVVEVSQPFTAVAASSAPMSPARVAPAQGAGPIPELLRTIWACGFLGIGCSWWIRWRRIRAIVRAGSPVHLEIPIRVVSSPALLEPGVFGVFRPIMLLPEGIGNRLTAAQLKGVIAHELCHVDHWDNLMAAIQMFVETVFWFHPLVWWIGKRMVEERELACDEEVLRLGSEPRAYAEGILEVCKLYLESPLVCVSGVAGSNLRKRVVAIMRNRVGVGLSPARKIVLSIAGALALLAPIGVGIVNAPVVRAQSAPAKDITGPWQGVLSVPENGAKRDLRILLQISKDGGRWKATTYSLDEGAQPFGGTISLTGQSFKLPIPGLRGAFEGKLDPEAGTLTGVWITAAGSTPLNLKHVKDGEAWEAPSRPTRIKPMAADADPAFDVTSLKLSNSERRGKGFGTRGTEYFTFNTTLSDMIVVAYNLNRRQIVGAPGWVDSVKYDLLAKPGGEGQPNQRQWKIMFQKMMVDRFQLGFHREKKELTVYAIVSGKGAPKITRSQSDPNGPISLVFHGPGDLPAKNVTMAQFAGILQSSVLDRPVVDQTGISGRYDFHLVWTPDESQLRPTDGARPDDPDAPPNLFAAMQEQLGLRLISTKAEVDVLVIDHAEKASEN
jgi:uncharacterized protein (TIGR03435 family)